jgi:hypothetical protein
MQSHPGHTICNLVQEWFLDKGTLPKQEPVCQIYRPQSSPALSHGRGIRVTGCHGGGHAAARRALARTAGVAQEGRRPESLLVALPGGWRVWGQAEFCQPGLQESQSAGDGVGPARGGLQVHDALVEIFVVGVVASAVSMAASAWPGLAGSRISAMRVQASSARRRAVSA